jgi:hypothetical protein
MSKVPGFEPTSDRICKLRAKGKFHNMGVPTSEVGYTSATAGRGDEVHKGHVVALEKINQSANIKNIYN